MGDRRTLRWHACARAIGDATSLFEVARLLVRAAASAAATRRPRVRIVARVAHAGGHVALVIKRLARVRRSVRLQRFPHGAQHQRLPRARADLDVSTTGEALGVARRRTAIREARPTESLLPSIASGSFLKVVSPSAPSATKRAEHRGRDHRHLGLDVGLWGRRPLLEVAGEQRVRRGHALHRDGAR